MAVYLSYVQDIVSEVLREVVVSAHPCWTARRQSREVARLMAGLTMEDVEAILAEASEL